MTSGSSGFLMTGQRGDPKTVRRPCLLRGTRCPEKDLDNRIMENINLPKIYVMKCKIRSKGMGDHEWREDRAQHENIKKAALNDRREVSFRRTKLL